MNTPTHPRPLAGFALGTVMVLALIMLAAVGALLGYATNELRAAHRNQLATQAFHLAEQGVELGIDALAAGAHKDATSGWAPIAGHTGRYKRTLTAADSSLDVFIDEDSTTTFTVRSRAEISRSPSLAASKAIRTKFTFNPTAGDPGNYPPPIIGVTVNLGDTANSPAEINRYGAFKSKYGEPVWNPLEFYPNSGTTAGLWTHDENNLAITNCFDGFRVISTATAANSLNLHSANILGKAISCAASIAYHYNSGASGVPPVWLGESQSAATATAGWTHTQRPYPGWVEPADLAGYQSFTTYGNGVTLDGKCLITGAPASLIDPSWSTAPADPVLDASGTVTNAGGSKIPTGTIPTQLGNSPTDNVNYQPAGTVTWPTDGSENASALIAQNFDPGSSSKIIINGPTTLIVTGNFKMNSDAVVFGPNGSLTVFQSGTHAEWNKTRSLTYTPLRDGNGVIEPPSAQSTALAAAGNCYDPKKLRLNRTAGGDVVLHPSETNRIICAEIVAPNATVELHADNARTKFIGRISGNHVVSTNQFDFFYDLDNGGGGGEDTKKWAMTEWQQIIPSTVSNTM
ncbi:MAG: hypothetical protein IPL39_07170 [Opitutaceae bacterium]|nr:hypothetical protein [Opitutaceae bacterium]